MRIWPRQIVRVVVATMLAGVLAPRPASAFELFGFKFFESENEDDGFDVINPLDYSVRIEITPTPDGDEDLASTLEDASVLVSDEDDPAAGSLGLIAKAKNDRKRLVAALYENARYDGLVYIFIDGQNVADILPDTKFDDSRPVPVLIRVLPGPKYTLGQVSVDAGGIPVDPSEFGLETGGSASSVAVLEAEAKLYNDLREEGRPFVAVTRRDILADAATDRLDYLTDLSPGNPVPFGETWVSGPEDVDPGFVAYMAGIYPGEVFSPEELEKARQRLVDLGVFSSVVVKEAKGQAPDGSLPVQVTVAERQNFGFYGLGATYSNTEGAGASGYIGHRNLFGRAENIRLDASVSRIGATAISGNARELDGFDFATSLVFKKPGVLGPDSVYVGSIAAGREQPLAYDRLFVNATSGVEYELDDVQTIAAGVKVEYEEITDFLDTRDYLIGSVPILYTFDNRDNELNPTEGFYAQARLEPSYGVNTQTFFLNTRLDGRTYYSPLESDRLILAGRLGYGTVFGADLEDVPNDRRFYAGGGGSVRGYEFQSISPYFPDVAGPGQNEIFVDTPQGGLSLLEGAAEARIGVTENIQVVPFVDFGLASQDLVPDFGDLKIGAGIGARYLTSFGPIRVDVGVPLDPGPRDASFQFYAGIGQAF
ncbi:autotransporter assembly complex family protein [Fulvimarina sp. 2208YS6-2-32]|uniref:Autotransporter assembly complex family protein n=1 Tax=Fulvimarina uroteuthidis TaxID=3098149 RepID=A0ABU5HZI4_9HYPH|nr:autotransporter assembly complex family protein [Fulvimarina sp. 2208YS6-2-32]MDY8108168.1 autotransporter assembly complex family protein [Fulvimarina sp. 2208YS6-2-32]